MARLLEVVAQEGAGADWLVSAALPALVAFACAQARGTPDHALLALPAFGALRCVLLARPEIASRPAVQSELKPLLAVGEASDPTAHEALELVIDIAALLPKRGAAGRLGAPSERPPEDGAEWATSLLQSERL